MAQNLNSTVPGSSPAKPAAKRLIPILLGGAGLVLLGGSGMLVGLNSKLTALQTSAQQKDAEVSSSEQIAHRYQATLDNYNQTQSHIKYLETSISDKSYVPTLLAQLQALAAQTHLTMSAIRPTASPPPAAPAAAPAAADGGPAATGLKKAPAPPPYDTLDVAVDISGSYADTNIFLYSLTRFPKIVSVDSVQMHPGTSTAPGGPLIVSTSLKLTAFMFHDAAAGSQPTGLPDTPAPVSAFVPPVSALAPAANAPGAIPHAASSAVSATQSINTQSAGELKTL